MASLAPALEKVTCPVCGAHLCDRAGEHYLFRADGRQRALVPGVDFIRCYRQIEADDGTKQRCTGLWKPEA